MSKIISLCEPYIDNFELTAVNKTIKTGWISSSGPNISLFEDQIKKITKSKYVVGCVNGSSALLISLNLLTNSRKGDIIIPSLSFISSVNSIIHNGCNPFFVDSNENFNIDENKLKVFLENHTFKKNNTTFNNFTKKPILGVLVTHMWGNSCNMEKIIKICKPFNLNIIEDAAESLGSFVKIKKKYTHTGTLGKIGCLSFNGNKIITTGGGGALLTNDFNLYKKAKLMIDHFKIDNYNYKYSDVGYNFKINNICATIGIAQLKKLNYILSKKRKIFKFYKEALNNIDGIKLLNNPVYSNSNNWMNVITIDKKKLKFQLIKL